MDRISSILKSAYENFVTSDIKNTEEVPSVEEWKAFLEKLGHDDDPIRESYRKYRCRILSFKPFKRFVLNTFAAGYLLLFRCRKVPSAGEKKDNGLSVGLRIEGFIDSGSFFPGELEKQYDKLIKVQEDELTSRILTCDALDAYRKARKSFFLHPYYLLLIKKDLIRYSNCMEKYSPDAIILYDAERDTSSPIITDLLEKQGKKYISFMHGEYLLQIIQAHMSFSDYYVWDQKFYVPMFKDILRCNIRHYLEYTPEKLKKKYHLENTVPDHLFTYYLSGESTKTLKNLRGVFDTLEKKGQICKVRPHPRYSHWDIIEELFSPEERESPQAEKMEDSFRKAKYIVGLSTTVLIEAYNEGKEIVIDDLTDPEQFSNLSRRFCRTLSMEHKLLSDIIDTV